MEKETLPVQIQWLLSLPVQIFKISLVLGTSLLLLYVVFQHIGVALIGYYYLQLAIVLNVLALAVFILFSFIEKEYQKRLLLRASVMLLNIPIALLYYYIFSLIF